MVIRGSLYESLSKENISNEGGKERVTIGLWERILLQLPAKEVQSDSDSAGDQEQVILFPAVSR